MQGPGSVPLGAFGLALDDVQALFVKYRDALANRNIVNLAPLVDMGK